ncbi:armadillo-type protein [Mycena sp. CBHHK59/15]|nr:armadillo-type protein [Mycena sp. CBHHK59/15]
MPNIILTLENQHWKTHIEMLKTLSAFAKTGLCTFMLSVKKIVDVMPKIKQYLADEDEDVRATALQTLGDLAALHEFSHHLSMSWPSHCVVEIFHATIKAAIPTIITLLADSETVRKAALQMFSALAKEATFITTIDSDSEIVPIITLLSTDADSETCAAVLQILSILAKQGCDTANIDVSEVSVVVNALKHSNSCVHVAGLQILENLAEIDANYEEIDHAIPEIICCLSDSAEEVQVAAIERVFKFSNNDTFHGRIGAVMQPDILPNIISSLLALKFEDILVSVLHILSSFATKEEFHGAINKVLPSTEKILSDTDEEICMEMLCTISDLAKIDKFCQTSNEFRAIVPLIVPRLSDPQANVRTTTLQTFLTISKQDIFHQIVTNSLPDLISATSRDNDGSRTEVLNTLSDLAKKDAFHDILNKDIPRDHMSADKDDDWPSRFAFINLMSNLGEKDVLRTRIDRTMPDMFNVLLDKDQETRLAGIQFLSIPAVKDSEEAVRVAVLWMLSDLAKQDAFCEAIIGALPALLNSLQNGDWRTRLASIQTWSQLGHEGAFWDIITRAAQKIAACMVDPDVDVRMAVPDTFSQFSTEVSDAAPDIMLCLDNVGWSTHVHELRHCPNLQKMVMDLVADSDEDVRFAAVEMLFSLIQQDTFRGIIHGTLQATTITNIIKLLSDRYKRVRTAALQLFPEIAQLDMFLDASRAALPTILTLLTDKDIHAALETFSALAVQDDHYGDEINAAIPKVVDLLKIRVNENKKDVLQTVSVFAKHNKYHDAVKTAIPLIISIVRDSQEEDCRIAALTAFSTFASQEAFGETVRKDILPAVISTLDHLDWRTRTAALQTLSEFSNQGILDIETDSVVPAILCLLQDPEEAVRIAAAQTIESLRQSQHEIPDDAHFHSVIESAWSNVLADLENPKPDICIAGLEKLPKITEYTQHTDEISVARVMPQIIASLKDSNENIILAGLKTLLRLAENSKAILEQRGVGSHRLLDQFRGGVVCTVPKITAILSNSKKELCHKINQEVSEIISTLKDPQARVASLKALIKLAKDEKCPDRIKLTMPYLLTLLQNQDTRKDAVALLTCLAADKTLRADLLSKVLPQLRGDSSPVSWDTYS